MVRKNTKFDLFHERPVLGVFSVISLAEQWRTRELPVNKTVHASILEIINPNLFYALPDEMPGKKPKFETYLCLSF